MGWTGQDERGESRVLGPVKSRPSESRKYGPGAQNRRGGALRGGAPCAKGADAARRRLKDSASRRSAPSLRGHGRKARPAPQNSPGLRFAAP